MDIQCRPMEINDFGKVECRHWISSEQVQQYIDRQGIASMLAFDHEHYAGQLYMQEYKPQFISPRGWTDDRPWADFQLAEPLGLNLCSTVIGMFS